MLSGNKTKTKISNKITKNVNLIPHFLRGIFDTDGCIKFSKQKKSFNYYPRIQFCFKDSPIIYDVRRLIDILNFDFGVWNEKRFGGLSYCQISGKQNLINFIIAFMTPF